MLLCTPEVSYCSMRKVCELFRRSQTCLNIRSFAVVTLFLTSSDRYLLSRGANSFLFWAPLHKGVCE